jgi:long-subunit fatty acid transport protein
MAERWRLGIGMHGVAGASLDFPPEEPGLENGFFTESASVAMPIALAYELRDDVWVGAGVVPLFGYLRNRFALPDPDGGPALPVKYALRGPGIQGLLGVTWRVDDTWSVGLGARTPGAIWMDGTTPFAGERRDVDLVVQMPAQLFAGVTANVTRELETSIAFRWTQSESFGDSDIEFDGVSLPFVPDAQNEWRISLGATYDVSEHFTLLLGTSYASRIVGNEGISPALFDTEDAKISPGVMWRTGRTEVHFMVGYGFEADRRVSAAEALALPGKYKGESGIAMLGFTQEL